MIGVVKDAGNHVNNRNHTNRRSDNAEINVGNDINNNGNEFETMVSGSVTVERLKDELYSLGHGEKKLNVLASKCHVLDKSGFG
jgi:hypothetical protein